MTNFAMGTRSNVQHNALLWISSFYCIEHCIIFGSTSPCKHDYVTPILAKRREENEITKPLCIELNIVCIILSLTLWLPWCTIVRCLNWKQFYKSCRLMDVVSHHRVNSFIVTVPFCSRYSLSHSSIGISSASQRWLPAWIISRNKQWMKSLIAIIIMTNEMAPPSNMRIN